MINIYSDSSQLASKYLKDTKANINNILIITGNFNIRDSLWDSNYLYYSIHSRLLFNIADSFFLGLSISINWAPTRYSGNNQDSNSVLDLMFLRFGSEELNNYYIHPDWCLVLDHALLTITIPIVEEYTQIKKYMIVKDSKKEKTFINEVIKATKDINTSNLLDAISLKSAVCFFAWSLDIIWEKNSKIINITKHLKSWWDVKCSKDLEMYRLSKHIKDWKQFKNMIKSTKHSFFDLKIQEITNKKQSPWELMN